MYTVREQAEQNLPAVLQAISKIGYQEVELYWNLYSHPAPELRRMLADHGLRAPSGHVDYKGFERKLDYAHALGFEYVVCPMLPKSMWNSLDGFKRLLTSSIAGERSHASWECVSASITTITNSGALAMSAASIRWLRKPIQS